MSLQYIINTATEVSLDRRKISGQTLSRSGMIRISSLASKVPWHFQVTPQPGMNIRTHRGVLESLDFNDRVLISTIDIGSSNPRLSYLTQYQGGLTESQRSQVTFTGANLTNIAMNFPGVLSGTVLFEAGDLVSLGTGYKYPYTVTNRVVKGSADEVTIPVSRPFINQTDFPPTGSPIRFGSEVTWNVVVASRPTYRITPGGWISWESDFELVEVIED